MASPPPLAFPSGESTSAADTAAPPQRPRQPYQKKSDRAFARSALQRQSVMALPSIRSLQRGFSRLALASETEAETGRAKSIAEMVGGPMSLEEKREARRRSSAARASLGASTVEEEEEIAEDDEEDEGRAERDLRLPWEKEDAAVVKTEQELRREVLEGLEGVCERWGLIAHLPSLSSSSPSGLSRRLSRSSHASASTSTSSSAEPSRSASPSLFLSPHPDARPLSPFSDATDITSASAPDVPLVLDLLALTTSAIRAAQAYVVALPASTFSSASPSPSTAAAARPALGASDAANRRSSHGDDLPHLRLSTAARPRTSVVGAVPLSREAKGKGKEAEGEEAGCLREMRQTSLEVLGLLREVEGRYRLSASSSFTSTPDEGDQAAVAPEYPSSLTLDAILEAFPQAEEQVAAWVEAVDAVLQNAGSVRKARGRRSDVSPDKDDRGEEREMPPWAVEEVEGGSLARAHLLFLSHAAHHPSPSAVPSSPPLDPAARLAFLSALSSGSLLCHAYNAVLRHSSARPFGFIPPQSVHALPQGAEGGEMERADSAMSEGEERKVGGTYRRAENLRLWAGALKFRYSLPLLLQSSSSSAACPSSPSPSAGDAALVFDAKLVARKEPGWDAMLERAVDAWAEAVGGEWREENGSG
ncbi:hypothetical protein JCM10213_002726 [Rhodosporidiobolus nylandii]